MTDIKKQQELANELSAKLWEMANVLRGNMEAYEFKNYILSLIFYRFLSEKTEDLMTEELANDGISYADAFTSDEYHDDIVADLLDTLGYVIEPQYLFSHVIKMIETNDFTIEYMEKIIGAIQESTFGQESQEDFIGLFEDMDLKSTKLGREPKQRGQLIAKVLNTINTIDFKLHDTDVDVLGTAYTILIGNFASTAGKKGGEFYTPTNMSKLVAKLATVGLTDVKKVSDPCCGSGSLLLQVGQYVNVRKYYGQELTSSTYNLARMNMMLHNVNFQNFDIINVDTLATETKFKDIKFDVQVSNPPYSAKWSADPTFLEDERFSDYGKLAPKGKADFAFLQHMIAHMDNGDSRIAILLPHGVLFRGAAEETIRKYIVQKLNYLDAVIGLPANCFHGATLPVCCLVLKKERNENSDNICFIDASSYFSQGRTINYITEEDIERIVNAYTDRKNIERFCNIASMQTIKDNNYNLNILKYVDSFNENEKEAPDDIEERYSKHIEERNQVNYQLISALKEIDKNIEDLTPDFIGKLFSGDVRFKDGNGNVYPTRKSIQLGELFEKISDRNKDLSIKNVICNSAKEGLIPQVDYFNKEIAVSENTDNYYIIQHGDFVYNPRKSIEAPFGPFNRYTYKEKGIVSPLYLCLHPVKADVNYIYVLKYLKSNNWNRFVYENGDVGARHDRVAIKDSILLTMPVPLPCKEEQDKISSLIELIDKKLEIDLLIIEDWKAIKKGLFQKMFV